MITSLILLNNKFTFLTLTIMQVTSKQFNLIIITFAFMLCQQTFCTKLGMTMIAYHYFLGSLLDYSLTFLNGA